VPLTPEALNEAKRALRGEAKARRAAEDAGDGAAAARLCALFLETFAAELGAMPSPTVSGYWPMGDELDVRPLLTRLGEQGRVCALPVVAAPNEALVFRRWRPGDRLVPAGFGTHEPTPDQDPVVPDIVLAPLLAFDDAGRRLGYGGGYYDRTLSALRTRGRVLAVGVGYQAQRVVRVPAGAGDERLDWIVTEQQAIRCGEHQGRT
jgi:5-formyltetrahydrofolate cyclo-ligase